MHKEQGEKVLTLHNKLPVISKPMSQGLQGRQPFCSPFFRPIRPRSRPLAPPPRVTNDNEALAVVLHDTKDRVRVSTYKSIHSRKCDTTVRTIQTAECTAKEPILICFTQFFGPEFVRVEDVLC